MTEHLRDYRTACNEVAKALLAQFDGGLAMTRPVSGATGAVVAQFTTRALRTYQAILLLCENGYGVESQSLVRMLLEDLINLRYVASAPEELSRAWAEHESRRRYQFYLSQREDDPDIEPPADLTELEAQYRADEAAVRSRHKSKKLSQRQVESEIREMSWTTLGLRGRARAADKSGKYEHTGHGDDQMYPYLCEHAQGGSTLASDYLEDVDGEVHGVPNPVGYKAVTPRVLATWYVHWIQGALGDLGLADAVDVMAIARAHADFDAPTSDLRR